MRHTTIETMLRDVPIKVKTTVYDDGVVHVEQVLLTNDMAGPLPQPVELPYGMLGDKDIEAIEEEARTSVQGQRDDETEANAKAREDTCGKLLSIIIAIGLGLAGGGGRYV
jgi:hypothetical protein